MTLIKNGQAWILAASYHLKCKNRKAVSTQGCSEKVALGFALPPFPEFSRNAFHPVCCLVQVGTGQGFQAYSKYKKSPELENLEILYDILLAGERLYLHGGLYTKEFLENGVQIRSCHGDRGVDLFRMHRPWKSQEKSVGGLES